ncbi:MAG: thiol:disulfide interchange protein DsbA/DsbL [Rhodocyclaceae bacterium]|nr:thiol:disulfide interchange protein DsbA/DsbL [Rhodocyclaceae bacterium]
MKFTNTLLAILTMSFLAATPALAAGLVEGKQFARLPTPQATEKGGKVEAVEFFSYGCPHCGDFEPLLKSWVKTLPADVNFKKVPVIFNDNSIPGARIYYTLEAMGLLEKLNDAVFHAVLKERVNLNKEQILFDWVAKQGVDRQKFADTYKSFTVETNVRRAADMTRGYGVDGVPVIIVGGKYKPINIKSFGDKLQIVDGLIAKNRAEIKK